MWLYGPPQAGKWPEKESTGRLPGRVEKVVEQIQREATLRHTLRIEEEPVSDRDTGQDGLVILLHPKRERP